MSLTQGTRLGPYEIVAPLGAGGMGEVYRARDTKLDRDVALKILPESFANDPDRLMRFEREAKSLASLNHPNIAAIYGIEDRALVMELVDGEDLSRRIAQGAMAMEEALAIAKQIAEALEAAHEAGIIHRDLKPANIKVRPDGTVKVLDFGLAKAMESNVGRGFSRADPGAPAGTPYVRAESLTVVSPAMTEIGMILGTAAYMAPEQAKGRPVDRRADVWAYGVILHEMLTGDRLFAADTVGESIAAVLTREPDWARVPAPARRLLQACLQKDPRKRLRDIGDAPLLLDKVPDPSTPVARSPLLPWVAGALIVGAVTAAGAIGGLRRSPSPAPFVFHESAPAGTRLLAAPRVSPDGLYLAILARDATGKRQIWTRALADEKARPLDGTEGASAMFWSPDSTELAFAAGGELRRIPRGGGLPKRFGAGTASSGVWTPDGEMVVAGPTGMFRVSADGGTPRQLLAGRQGVYADLALLSSGRHLLFRQFGGETGLYVLDLATDKVRRLEWEAVATARVGAVSFAAPDVILYMQNQVLVGRRVDPASLTLVGDPFPVVEGIRGFVGSDAGAITYLQGAAVAARLTWRNREGRSLGTVGPEGDYREVYLSPSGRRLMFVVADQATRNMDLWIQDPQASAANRLTTDPDVDHLAAFSPDDREVVWEGHRSGTLTLFRRRSDGAGDVRIERPWNRGGGPTDWSPDGKFVLYQTQEVATRNDLWVVPMQGKTEPFPLVASEFEDTDGKVSPDGRWLAYVSTSSGQAEIYLQRLDGWSRVGGPLRVSSGGGAQPIWRRDGSELFYLANDTLTVVKTSLDAERPAGTPQALFSIAGATGTNDYAVSPDGQRFIMIEGDRETAHSAVVVMHWTSGLTKR